MSGSNSCLLWVYAFTAGPFVGGHSRRAAAIVESLNDRYIPAKLICPRIGANRLIDDGIISAQNVRLLKEPPKAFQRFKLNTLYFSTRMIFLIFRNKPCQVHSFQSLTLISFLVALATAHVTRHTVSEVSSLLGATRTKLKKKALIYFSGPLFDRIDCLSPQIKREVLRSSLPSNHKKIKVSPCSFSPFPICPAVAHKKDTPQGVDHRDVVFLGGFHKEKGALLFIDVLEQLGLKDKVTAGVYGSGPEEEKIRERIESLPRSVHCNVGYLSDPKSVLCQYRIFVSLQQYDNYPSQALIQAMQAGCAVIATNVGCTSLLVTESCGILVERTVESVSDAILYLLQNPLICVALGDCAKNHVNRWGSRDKYLRYFMDDVMLKIKHEKI